MQNKRPLLAVALFSICLSLSSCNNKNDEASNVADLFYAYSTENLLSDWNYLSDDEEMFDQKINARFKGRDHTLRYNLMQGEHDAMQLMIHAKKYINSFDFTLPSLVGPNGATISSENFSTSVAWYQEIFSTNEKQSYPGLYPDALIPLEKYEWRRQNHIDKDRNEALYIDFLSTYEMAPGKYTGTGELTLDDEKISIPFEVTIYDAKMPEEVHWNSSYLIWYDEIVNGERENTDNDMYMKYWQFVVDHRMTPDGLPDHMENTPEKFAENTYRYVANNPKITSHRTPFGLLFTKEKARSYLQALIDKNLELRAAGDLTTDLFKKIYFYSNDEPHGSDAKESCRKNDRELFELKNEMKDQLVAYPELVESFTHIKSLVTIEYSEDLKATNEQGGVQCWCPQYQWFDTPEQRQLYRDRQNSTDRDYGENVWWYGCMDPDTYYPSNHLDADLIMGRVLSWMQFDYYVEGNVYWNVCYYSKQGAHATESRDIWFDAMTWLNVAGDGALVYPGIDYGIDGPISTLRMESIQACSEEYEYLYMIDEKINQYNAINHTTLDSRELLNKYFSKLYLDMTPYKDTQVFENTRIEVLKICELLNDNLSEGVRELQKEGK